MIHLLLWVLIISQSHGHTQWGLKLLTLATKLIMNRGLNIHVPTLVSKKSAGDNKKMRLVVLELDSVLLMCWRRLSVANCILRKLVMNFYQILHHLFVFRPIANDMICKMQTQSCLIKCWNLILSISSFKIQVLFA